MIACCWNGASVSTWSWLWLGISGSLQIFERENPVKAHETVKTGSLSFNPPVAAE